MGEKKIAEYRRETWIVLPNFLHCRSYFRSNKLQSVVQGLPAVCKIARVDFFSNGQLERYCFWNFIDSYIIKIYGCKKKHTTKKKITELYMKIIKFWNICVIVDWLVKFLRFFLFIFRLIGFWILHWSWNRFINCLCFIIARLHGKIIVV